MIPSILTQVTHKPLPEPHTTRFICPALCSAGVPHDRLAKRGFRGVTPSAQAKAPRPQAQEFHSRRTLRFHRSLRKRFTAKQFNLTAAPELRQPWACGIGRNGGCTRRNETDGRRRTSAIHRSTAGVLASLPRNSCKTGILVSFSELLVMQHPNRAQAHRAFRVTPAMLTLHCLPEPQSTTPRCAN